MAYMVGEGWRDLFDVIIVQVGQIIQSPPCDAVYYLPLCRRVNLTSSPTTGNPSARWTWTRESAGRSRIRVLFVLLYL